MAERAHPEHKGFKDKCFGLIKNKYKQKLYERYLFCNDYIRNKIVLDVPCGTGWGTSILKEYKEVYGLDICKEAIEYATIHFPGNFVVASMSEMPFDENTFDVVICLEGLEHVSTDIGARFIEEIKRVLKPCGLLIVTCPVLNEKGETTGNPYHLYEYPEYELVEILNKNFRILSLERIKGPDGPEYRAVVSNFKEKRYIE